MKLLWQKSSFQNLERNVLEILINIKYDNNTLLVSDSEKTCATSETKATVINKTINESIVMPKERPTP